MLNECKGSLGQERLEAHIVGLMHCIRREAPIREQFSNSEIVEILHHGADLFMSKPILLEFDLPHDGLIVVGDLHGNIYSLLRTFERHGLPPKTHYLFLGDYIDRGQQQLELIILLILLKIRWPDYMLLLRGNHETVGFMNDDCLQMFIHGEFFAKVCQNQLASTLNMYFMFNQMFDVMPIAAIISGHYFCCHGGVSQWMTCLENIRNIPRPTYAKSMKFLEACMLADILWADPEPTLKKAFAVSRRGCGYMFSREGLGAVLEALNLKTLIRGHEMYMHGTTRNFEDDSCVTVHTAPSGFINFSAVLKLTCVGGIHRFEQITEEMKIDAPVTALCRTLTEQFMKSFKENTFIELSRSRPCQWCSDPPPSYFHERVRLYAHRDMDLWVRQYAGEWAEKDHIFLEIHKLHRIDVPDPTYEERRIQRSAELFPVYYDLRFLKGGNAFQGGTFRVLVSDDEKQLMKKVYPYSEFVYERVPLSNYDSPESLEGIVERNERKKRDKKVLKWFEIFWLWIWSRIRKCCVCFPCFHTCRCCCYGNLRKIKLE